MTTEGDKGDIPIQPLSDQPSSSGAKRKRGRPRKHGYTVCELPQRVQPIQSAPPLCSKLDDLHNRHDGMQVNHTSAGCVESRMHRIPKLPAHQSQGKGVIIGKHFIGKMAKKCPGFSLITVKVKDNLVLKGWVPVENNLLPITLKNDLAPELPMLLPSQVRKQAHGAPPMPVHFEDITLAKPLQMRRPAEESIAKHTIPPAPRPWMGSGVVAAVPISVSSGNAVSRTLSKHAESVSQEPSADTVPVKSVQPVSISLKQGGDQDVLVEDKPITEVHKVSESSNGSKESSGMDGIKVASGPMEQLNATNSKQEILKESPDYKGQSEQPKKETDILKGVDGSKSGASDADAVQSAHDEDSMNVDNK